MLRANFQQYKPQLVRLFFLVAFPIHVWSIFQTFENIGWVAERTFWGDAIGYGAYALLAAFVESALVFLLTVPLFFLLTSKHAPDKALTITALTYLTFALLWVFRLYMINQSGDQYFLDTFIHNLADQSGWRRRYRYVAFLLAAALLSLPVVLVPFLARRYDRPTAFLLALAERVEILMYLIFGLDVLAVILIIVRNILGAL